MESSIKQSLSRWLIKGMCLYLLVGCAPELSQEELIDRARAALELKDLSAAEVDIKTVLQASAEDAEARSLYGYILLERMNPAAAIEQFDRSLAAKEDLRTRLWLARALANAGNGSRLIDDWELGNFVTVHGDPVFQAALALAFLVEAKEEEARNALTLALAEDSDDPNYVAVVDAMLALQLDSDISFAERRLLEVVGSDPGNAQAQSLLGLIALQNQDLEAAVSRYQAAVAANPFRLGDKLQLAEAQLRLGDADGADLTLAQLERAIPKNPAVHVLRGQLLFDNGDYPEAIDLFSQILLVYPDNLVALLLSANANSRLDRLTEAQRLFEDYIALRPTDVNARLQLARVYALAARALKAEAMARSVLEIDPVNEAAQEILSIALASQGRHAESAQVLALLAEQRPDSAETRVALGTQQFFAGDIEAGMSKLEGAVREFPDSGTARERLIEAKLSARDMAGATEAAEAYLALKPEDVRALLYLARVRLQASDTEVAEQLFQKALDLDPANVDARIGLGAIAVIYGDLEGARLQFEGGLKDDPGNLLLSINLGAILEQSGDLMAVEAVMDSAMTANPGAVEPRLALARLALNKGDAGQVVAVLSPLIEAEVDDHRIHELLTLAYLDEGQFTLANNSAKLLLETGPNSTSDLLLAARVSFRIGEFVEAESRIRRAIEARGASAELRKALIEILYAQGRLDEASSEIENLPKDVRSEVPLLILQGRIALARSDFEAGRSFFLAAHEAAPSSASLLALHGAETELGNTEVSIQLLTEWLSDNPEDLAVRSVYAAELLIGGANDAASAEYEVILEGAPNHVPSLNNLAWLLRAVDNDRALDLIKRADELAPRSADVKDTYAMVLAANGAYEQALRLNERASALDGGNLQIKYNRAKILAEAGRGAEAGRLLDGLMSDSSFNVTDEVRALRDSI